MRVGLLDADICWVNMRAIFHKIKTFEEYSKRKAKE